MRNKIDLMSRLIKKMDKKNVSYSLPLFGSIKLKISLHKLKSVDRDIT